MVSDTFWKSLIILLPLIMECGAEQRTGTEIPTLNMEMAIICIILISWMCMECIAGILMTEINQMLKYYKTGLMLAMSAADKSSLTQIYQLC